MLLDLLRLTFQLHRDGIRHHLHTRDVELADVGAVIRARGRKDAAREKHKLGLQSQALGAGVCLPILVPSPSVSPVANTQGVAPSRPVAVT